jgi:hypothetical protein
MITIVSTPADAALANRIREDLRAGGYAVGDAPDGHDDALIVVISPAANADGQVEWALNKALDHNIPIVPVLAAPADLPKLIDHLQALDFSQNYNGDALREQLTPQKHLPLRVLTPSLRKSNRRIGLWVALLAILWFVIGLYEVGVVHIQQGMTNDDNTAQALVINTIQSLLATNIPHSTADALNFPATVKAAPIAQQPFLITTATAQASR